FVSRSRQRSPHQKRLLTRYPAGIQSNLDVSGLGSGGIGNQIAQLESILSPKLKGGDIGVCPVGLHFVVSPAQIRAKDDRGSLLFSALEHIGCTHVVTELGSEKQHRL